jgi:hypothetical protein
VETPFGDSELYSRMIQTFGEDVKNLVKLLKMSLGLIFMHFPCLPDPLKFKGAVINRFVRGWQLMGADKLDNILMFGVSANNTVLRTLYVKYKDTIVYTLKLFNDEMREPTYRGFGGMSVPIVNEAHYGLKAESRGQREYLIHALGLEEMKSGFGSTFEQAHNTTVPGSSIHVKGLLTHFLSMMDSIGMTYSFCGHMNIKDMCGMYAYKYYI